MPIAVSPSTILHKRGRRLPHRHSAQRRQRTGAATGRMSSASRSNHGRGDIRDETCLWAASTAAACHSAPACGRAEQVLPAVSGVERVATAAAWLAGRERSNDPSYASSVTEVRWEILWCLCQAHGHNSLCVFCRRLHFTTLSSLSLSVSRCL